MKYCSRKPELLQNLRVYENGELNRAAIMAFHPDPEKWIIGAYTKIGYFANDADILFQDEVHGSLLTQVEDAIDIIYTKYMKALISYNDIHREELYFFPRGAFRELLLNALIHKDYTQPYPIQIQIYRDKIDIWNIGTMPENVQIKDLYQRHPSVPRNPKIADIFFKCGFVESWGRGYFKIKSICEEFKASLPEPTVLTGGLSVVCNASEIYRKLAVEYKVDGFVGNIAGAEQVTEQVTEQVRKLIACLKGKTLSKKEILVALDMKHRPTLEQDYINPALELGLIEMTQPDSPRSPTQKYRLTKKGKSL